MEEQDHEHGPRCPNCGWTDVRHSKRHGFLDNLIGILGLIPYRCRSCGTRFYRTRDSEIHPSNEA